MGRLILLLGVVIGAVVLIRRILSISLPHQTDKIKKTNAEKTPPDETQPDTIDEPMLKCRQCGVHSPKSKGFSEGEHFFCSNEHKSEFLSNTNKENTS
ncbi:MAG: hypothetical protein COB51_00830 [Moraxellaceae bacterium]|nr:MAG: hypothetical protein COB51_00830 [Moraxellaceae bacterium]